MKNTDTIDISHLKNYKFKLFLYSKDIYNNLAPEQKEQFNNIQITRVTLVNGEYIEIECLALKDEVEECPFVQRLSLSDGDQKIVAFDSNI